MKANMERRKRWKMKRRRRNDCFGKTDDKHVEDEEDVPYSRPPPRELHSFQESAPSALRSSEFVS